VSEAQVTGLGTLAVLKAHATVAGNSWVLDEDTMVSDSATKVPTQQSTKAYVDTRKLTDIAVAADLTSHDVTIARPGLVPKASGDTGDFLRGDGAWAKPTLSPYTLSVFIPNISEAGSYYVAFPLAGTITRIQSVLQSAITVADANLTFHIGVTELVDSAIVIAYDGSGAGDLDSSTPSDDNTVAVGSVLKITSDGGSTDAAHVFLTILVER
jgi:hypothetical protein